MDILTDEDECINVLRDPKGCVQFRLYLKMVIACEILDFWIEIELFRARESMGNEERQKSLQIYHKYCRPSSMHAINIPDKTRKTIKNYMRNQIYHTHMFDEAQQHIYNLLALDPFVRFKESDFYRLYKGQKSVNNSKLNTSSVYSMAFFDHVRTRKEKRTTNSTENLILYVNSLKKQTKKEKKSTSNILLYSSNNSNKCNSNYVPQNLATKLWCGMITKSTIIAQ